MSSSGRRSSFKDSKAEKSKAPDLAPFKPHRKLVAVLGISFAIWVAFLVALYVKTVYPMRHGAHPTTETQEIEKNGR